MSENQNGTPPKQPGTYSVPRSMRDQAEAQAAAERTRTLRRIDFASDEAAELAYERGLSAEAIRTVKPSGQGGYTVADIRSLETTPDEER